MCVCVCVCVRTRRGSQGPDDARFHKLDAENCCAYMYCSLIIWCTGVLHQRKHHFVFIVLVFVLHCVHWCPVLCYPRCCLHSSFWDPKRSVSLIIPWPCKKELQARRLSVFFLRMIMTFWPSLVSVEQNCRDKKHSRCAKAQYSVPMASCKCSSSPSVFFCQCKEQNDSFEKTRSYLSS